MTKLAGYISSRKRLYALYSVLLASLHSNGSDGFSPLRRIAAARQHRHRDRLVMMAAGGGGSSSSDSELSRRQAWDRVAAVTTASGLVLPTTGAVAAAATENLPKVPTTRLGDSSLEVSRTIQGYWQLAGGHGRYREEDAIANMEAHFKAGITTLDTADICE